MAVLNVQIARAEKNAPRSKRFEATIDSGAGRCIFHSDIGKAIGLDVEKGQPQETVGVTGKPSRLYVHDVSLYIPGGVIAIQAGFTDSLPIAGLLGMTGFFDHFRVSFNPTAAHCELERIYQA
jgi:hypothetical protein